MEVTELAQASPNLQELLRFQKEAMPGKQNIEAGDVFSGWNTSND